MGTQIGTTTPGRVDLGVMAIEGTLHPPNCRSEASPSDGLASYTGYSLWEGLKVLPHPQADIHCHILHSQPTGLKGLVYCLSGVRLKGKLTLYLFLLRGKLKKKNTLPSRPHQCGKRRIHIYHSSPNSCTWMFWQKFTIWNNKSDIILDKSLFSFAFFWFNFKKKKKKEVHYGRFFFLQWTVKI